MKRYRWPPMHASVLLYCLAWLVLASQALRAEFDVREVRNETDTRLEIVCIKDPKSYCKDKEEGTIFSDGCRECQCKADDAYCKSVDCVVSMSSDTNPEDYCADILAKNENPPEKAVVTNQVNWHSDVDEQSSSESSKPDMLTMMYMSNKNKNVTNGTFEGLPNIDMHPARDHRPIKDVRLQPFPEAPRHPPPRMPHFEPRPPFEHGKRHFERPPPPPLHFKDDERFREFPHGGHPMEDPHQMFRRKMEESHERARIWYNSVPGFPSIHDLFPKNEDGGVYPPTTNLTTTPATTTTGSSTTLSNAIRENATMGGSRRGKERMPPRERIGKFNDAKLKEETEQIGPFDHIAKLFRKMIGADKIPSAKKKSPGAKQDLSSKNDNKTHHGNAKDQLLKVWPPGAPQHFGGKEQAKPLRNLINMMEQEGHRQHLKNLMNMDEAGPAEIHRFFKPFENDGVGFEMSHMFGPHPPDQPPTKMHHISGSEHRWDRDGEHSQPMQFEKMPWEEMDKRLGGPFVGKLEIQGPPGPDLSRMRELFDKNPNKMPKMPFGLEPNGGAREPLRGKLEMHDMRVPFAPEPHGMHGPPGGDPRMHEPFPKKPIVHTEFDEELGERKSHAKEADEPQPFVRHVPHHDRKDSRGAVGEDSGMPVPHVEEHARHEPLNRKPDMHAPMSDRFVGEPGMHGPHEFEPRSRMSPQANHMEPPMRHDRQITFGVSGTANGGTNESAVIEHGSHESEPQQANNTNTTDNLPSGTFLVAVKVLKAPAGNGMLRSPISATSDTYSITGEDFTQQYAVTNSAHSVQELTQQIRMLQQELERFQMMYRTCEMYRNRMRDALKHKLDHHHHNSASLGKTVLSTAAPLLLGAYWWL